MKTNDVQIEIEKRKEEKKKIKIRQHHARKKTVRKEIRILHARRSPDEQRGGEKQLIQPGTRDTSTSILENCSGYLVLKKN